MRSRKLAIGVGLGLLVAVATTVPALAQSAAAGGAQPYPAVCSPASVSTNESDRAHKLYEAGKVYYDDNNNDGAIAKFREAYKVDCTKHELLVIISRAYQLKGDLAEAIRALETYLERAPTSPEAGSLRTRIDNMKKQLAAQQASTAAPSATVTTPPPATEVREHTIPPWIVVGVGGLGIIAGIVVLATAPSIPAGCNEDTDTCTRITNPDGKLEDANVFAKRQEIAGTAKSQRIGGTIVVGAGVAIVAGGLLWHFLEPTGPVEKTGRLKPRFSPELGPGFAGMSLGGAF